jgi:hypothetical protein
MMDRMDNPYQSPIESGEQPRFTLRRAVGMVIIVLSGMMAASAAFPPVILVVHQESRVELIVGALMGTGLMLLAALGTFWLGWRRWRVPRQRPGMTVHSASGPATESTSLRELT